MTSMYEMFTTDSKLERGGVIIDYGSFRVTIARAGGSNKKFARVLTEKTKPYRRSMQTETMANDVAERVMREVYADAVILNWETLVEDDWQQGMESSTGDLLPFTRDNVLKTITALPELFADISEQANKVAIYREHVVEEDSKNL